MSLLQMSFAGGVIILAVIVIRALAINLLPKKTFEVLWGIVVVRLLIPFSVPSMFSVYSLLDRHASVIDTARDSQAIGMLPTETTGQMAAMADSISNAFSIWTVIWAVGVLVCAVTGAATFH